MNKKELTIIIPFINEKYELEDTIKSIRDYSDCNNVEIIAINDASDDNFDYKSIVMKYDAIYIENKVRIGVAASRDLGVKASSTSYFLLLDAHMRFYNKLWTNRIIEELKRDSKVLLCCQTKALLRVNGVLVEDVSRTTSYGACVVLNDTLRLFEPNWIKKKDDSSLKTIPIPCVLGAGYACSKEFWELLKGLEGLIQYGNDEAYISLKVWMSGGACKLLKDIEIGHIYRNSHPYSRDKACRLYNYLFLSEMFLQKNECKKHLSTLKLFYEKKILGEAQYKLQDNHSLICDLKKHYDGIFINDIVFFKNMNNQYLPITKHVDDMNNTLTGIVKLVTDNIPANIGLIDGQMGIVIFFYHFANFSKNKYYWEQSDTMLKHIIKNIKSDLPYCFTSGLCGIGWGIEYLHQNGFIEADTNKMLEYIDKKIMEIDPLRIEDIDKDYGFGGVVLYLLARLYTIHNKKTDNPFDELYLSCVYRRVKEIIDQRITESNSVDVFLAFLHYHDNNHIEKSCIYDVCSLLNLQNIPLQDLEPGLKGCAGVGVTLILDNCAE